MRTEDIYHPKTECAHCHYAINGLNRWWCSAHHRVIRSGDLPCEEFKGKGTIGVGVVPVKSEEQVRAEKAKLTNYVPLLAIKAEQARKEKQEQERLKRNERRSNRNRPRY